MHIHLIAVGQRMPGWVRAGFEEYVTRLPPSLTLRLTELPLGDRGKGSDPQRALAQQGRKMAAAIPVRARVVALDVKGSRWSTEDLAERLTAWMGDGRDVALIVGGPDGVSPPCLARADERWSLSALTFPHMLVRVIVAEQLYRAWTITTNHPYHRA